MILSPGCDIDLSDIGMSGHLAPAHIVVIKARRATWCSTLGVLWALDDSDDFGCMLRERPGLFVMKSGNECSCCRVMAFGQHFQ